MTNIQVSIRFCSTNGHFDCPTAHIALHEMWVRLLLLVRQSVLMNCLFVSGIDNGKFRAVNQSDQTKLSFVAKQIRRRSPWDTCAGPHNILKVHESLQIGPLTSLHIQIDWLVLTRRI
jgi:hypothetical protein